MKTQLIIAILLLQLSTQAQSFTEQLGLGFTGLNNPKAVWFDYNNDNHLDLIIQGQAINGSTIGVTKLYKNNGNNSFTEQTSIGFANLARGNITCGDYNNDGNIDVLMFGLDSSGMAVTKLYKNNGNNSFTEIPNLGIHQLSYGAVAWGDYDLDIFASGQSSSGSYISKLKLKRQTKT